MQALKPWADARILTWFYSTAYEEETRQRRLFFDAKTAGYVPPYRSDEEE